NEFLEDRFDRREVEADTGEVRMSAGKGRRNHALSRTKIHEGLVVLPWEVGGNGVGRASTYSAHRAQKPSQLLRVGIQRRKQVLSAPLALVLQFTGAQRLGERSPEPIEPGICHFQKAADVGWLGGIEKQVGVGGIAVDAVLTLQEVERHQPIEEVA